MTKVQSEIMSKAMQTPELANMLASFQTNAPQLQVDIDRVKAKSMGVSLTDIFETLQINLGSLYVNDFNRFGRTAGDGAGRCAIPYATRGYRPA